MPQVCPKYAPSTPQVPPKFKLKNALSVDKR